MARHGATLATGRAAGKARIVRPTVRVALAKRTTVGCLEIPQEEERIDAT